MKKSLYLMVLIVLCVSVVLNIGMYRHIRNTQVNKSDTVEVVRFDTIRGTLPEVRYEKVTRYITLHDSMLIIDTITNEITLPIVQRQYSDDSTYTAYVSGAKVDSFPRLDSILVRQKTIERVITNTIFKKQHWRFGIGATGGISVTTRKPDVVIGVFGGYTF